ncbi:MAG: 23S rRNA (pseudouridine(1915)-N(3))-methyltransferase RlmH [Gemmatimonadota bacterium]
MKVLLVAVGRPGRLLAPAIREYEARAARYWPFEVVEVREEKARGTAEDVRSAESERLLAAVPDGVETVAVTRTGKAWSSTRLARYLQDLAVQSAPGAAFLIGGALGLAPDTIAHARHRLSLSAFTLPHDIARLHLAEQIYRAGTITRGEPYHKGAE